MLHTVKVNTLKMYRKVEVLSRETIKINQMEI